MFGTTKERASALKSLGKIQYDWSTCLDPECKELGCGPLSIIYDPKERLTTIVPLNKTEVFSIEIQRLPRDKTDGQSLFLLVETSIAEKTSNTISEHSTRNIAIIKNTEYFLEISYMPGAIVLLALFFAEQEAGNEFSMDDYQRVALSLINDIFKTTPSANQPAKAVDNHISPVSPSK